jgi:hypothetical protein
LGSFGEGRDPGWGPQRDHAHLTFLQLRPSFACGDFYFVHAGVRPGVPLDKQQEADQLWIRNEFLESEKNFGKYIVHGYTPVLAPDIGPTGSTLTPRPMPPVILHC